MYSSYVHSFEEALALGNMRMPFFTVPQGSKQKKSENIFKQSLAWPDSATGVAMLMHFAQMVRIIALMDFANGV